MQYMPVTSSMFLIAETREQPMHVGGLQLFVPRDGQSADELADEVMAAFNQKMTISEIFRKRPAQPFSLVGSLAWSIDDDVDLHYHVRRIALPKPGRIRELFHYVSLNHSTLLDRSRPMWEAHVIEGLADGRLALYTKVHHSLVDGVSALRLLERTLSTDPDARDATAPWDIRLRAKATPATAEIDALPPAPPAEADSDDGILGVAQEYRRGCRCRRPGRRPGARRRPRGLEGDERRPFRRPRLLRPPVDVRRPHRQCPPIRRRPVVDCPTARRRRRARCDDQRRRAGHVQLRAACLHGRQRVTADRPADRHGPGLDAPGQ